MAELVKRWAGHLYGTNTGNLFVELDGTPDAVTGTVRFMDTQFGLSVFTATGTFVDGHLLLRCIVQEASQGVQFGEIDIDAVLTPEGMLRGDWKSTLGTAGTFGLHPHGGQPQLGAGPRPDRLHIAAREFGSLSLGADDVRSLIQTMSADMAGQWAVVTYPEGGLETSRFAPDFEGDILTIGKVDWLRVNIQAQEPMGGTRSVSVEISRNGVNQVRVQGMDRVWVRGKLEVVADLLRGHQRRMVTGLRKWGLNINSWILAVGVIVMSDLPLFRRFVFAAAIIAIIFSIAWLHRSFVPGAVIRLSPKDPSWIEKSGPQVLSWFIAMTSAVAASVIYGLLSDTPWWDGLRSIMAP